LNTLSSPPLSDRLFYDILLDLVASDDEGSSNDLKCGPFSCNVRTYSPVVFLCEISKTRMRRLGPPVSGSD
jgi:hypothetical protein